MTEPAIIQIDRWYSHASTAAVWAALTQPQQLERWWVTGDIRPAIGHRFSLDMGAWGKPVCEVLDAMPERLLRYRFTRGAVGTTVTWEVAAEGDGTRVKLRQEGFDLQNPAARETFEALNNGWPLVLAKLATVLATRT